MIDSMTLAPEPETNVSTTANLNNPATLAALVCIFIMGPMFLLMMPLYVGALTDDLGLNNQQIGTLTSLELLGSCLASLSALLWIRRVNWRKMAAAGALALLACNILSTLLSSSLETLTLIRIAAGFSAGGLMAVAIAAMSDTARLDRNFALAVAGQLSISGVLFFLLPQMIAQQGVNAIFELFAGGALLALMACYFVPLQGKDHSQSRLSSGSAWRPLWGLAGSATFFISQTALWAFVERMGVAAHLSNEFIGDVLGTSVLISIGAALGAGWLTQFISRFWLMVVAAIGQLICFGFLIEGFSATTFFIAVLAFQICWNGWVPIQMANIAEVDTSGRFTVVIGLFQAIGVATGPILVTQFLTGNSFLAVNIIGAIFVVLTVILFSPVALRQKA